MTRRGSAVAQQVVAVVLIAAALAAGCSGATPADDTEVVADSHREPARTGPDRAGANTARPDDSGVPDSLLFDPELAAALPPVFDDPSLWWADANAGPAAELVPVIDPTFPAYDHLDLPLATHVATVFDDGVASTAEPGDGLLLHWFGNPTQFGGDRVFLVLDQTSSPDYIKVSLPLKPNGQEGWIPRDAVVISQVEHRAVVDLANDSLTVWRGDDVIVQTKAVTGAPATPTPVGRFYVRDIIAHSNPAGAYGPYIVALSGFSEVLESFGGGLPAIAIHGTNRPGLIGQERSNGCIRIPNELVTALAGIVPLGTPVTVVA